MAQDFELTRKIEKLNILLDKATSRMESLFGKSQKCVLGNQYEHDRWARIKVNEAGLKKQDTEGASLLPTWPQLSNDLYSALHRTHTVLFDEDQIHPKWRGNRALLAEVINTDEYERIHDVTMGDANMVVVAALKIQEGWIEELRKQKQVADQRRQQLKQEREERKQQQQQNGQPGDGESPGGSSVQSGQLPGDGTQGQDQEPGTGTSGSPGPTHGTDGESGQDDDQEESDPSETPESGVPGDDGEEEAGDYEPVPERNNSVEQYETGQNYTRSCEAARIAVEAAEKLAEAGMVGTSVENAIAAAEAALEASQGLEERIEDQLVFNEMTQDTNQQTDAIRKAMRLAVKEAKEQDDTLHAWGVEKGMLKGMDPKEAMELSKLMRDSDNLKQIAKLIGNNRVTLKQRKVKEQLAHGPTLRVGVEQGSNLTKLMASQKLMMIAAPDLFRWRYANRNLQVYKTKMEQWQDDGTGVVWVDSSGSMWSGYPFTYSQVAKATAITIMEYLHDQGRDCVVGLFDHGVREVLEIPKDASPMEMLRHKIHLATHDYGGGTDFFEPLMAGFAKIKETKYLESADQVLITDGQCYLSDDQVKKIKEEQDETKVNIMTVLMPGGRATQMEQFGPVDTVSTSLDDASKLAASIVERMESGNQA